MWTITMGPEGLVQDIHPIPDKGYVSRFGPPCMALCGHRLNRWHLSCFTCRIRRVWMGKVPSKGRVSVYVMYIQHDIPLRRLRRILLKRLLTLCEVLAS